MASHPLLGKFIRDRVTFMTGVTYAILEKLNGNIQLAYAYPETTDDSGSSADVETVEAFSPPSKLKFKPLTPVAPHADSYKIALGSEVEDVVSGIKGIVIERTTYLNGCVYYTFVPRAPKGDVAPPKPIMTVIDRLKIVGNGIAKPADAPPKKRIGGPSGRVALNP